MKGIPSLLQDPTGKEWSRAMNAGKTGFCLCFTPFPTIGRKESCRYKVGNGKSELR